MFRVQVLASVQQIGFMSKEEIKAAIEELAWPGFVEHNEWIADDGQRCSSWTFKTPGASFQTGDGGAKLFYQCLQEEAQKRFGK